MLIMTPEKDMLETLQCERLSAHPENRDLIKNVINHRNSNLVDLLQSEGAWQDDSDNKTAYYLVKSAFGTILAFFSLRCGEVFQNVDEKLIERAKEYSNNLNILNDPNSAFGERQRATIELEVANADGWNKDTADYYISKSTRREKDLSKDLNKDNHHVADTFSAIELTIFCKNEAYGVKEEWDSLGLEYRMGECIFWYFIMSKIEDVVNLVGCEYFYLFAADKFPDGKLVEYYKRSLKLETPVNLGANKPSFDYECLFLCQRVIELFKHRDKFFKIICGDQ